MAATEGKMPQNLPGQSEGDVARRGLVSLNKLDYTLQPDLSVAVSRSYKQHFSQQTSYNPGQRIIIISNSGAEYVRADTSFLSFTVKNSTPLWSATFANNPVVPLIDPDTDVTYTPYPGDGAADAAHTAGTVRKVAMGLGSGSAVNFIRRITLTSRSGDEIERIERLNQLVPILDNYTKSPEWFRTIGQMMGYSPQRGFMSRYDQGPKIPDDSSAQGVAMDARAWQRAVATANVQPSGLPEGANTGVNNEGAATHFLNTDATGQPSAYRASREVHGLHPGFVIPAVVTATNPPGATSDTITASEVTFVIPLSCILGLFKSCDKLLPSMLMSGLRFEIELEDANVVARMVEGGMPPPTQVFGLQNMGPQNGEVYSRFSPNRNVLGSQRLTAATTAAGYNGSTTHIVYKWPPVDADLGNLVWSIENPIITFDQYQLTDSIQRVLNEESAMRGLEVVFSTFHNTQSSVSGNKLRQEVRKAVSRALTTITKTRGQLSGTVTEALRDSFLGVMFDRTSWQVRIGSLYFPQQPVNGTAAVFGKWCRATKTTPDNGLPLVRTENTALKTSYFHTLRAFNKIATPSAPCAVSLSDFQGYPVDDLWYATTTNGGNNCEYGGYNVLAVDLERSNVQKLTGIPINNARVLEVRIDYNSSSNGHYPTSTVADTWLHYVRLLRVFLQNVEVEE